jgi:hypothetical protein
VKGNIRIGVFAALDINAGTELSFDYNVTYPSFIYLSYKFSSFFMMEILLLLLLLLLLLPLFLVEKVE